MKGRISSRSNNKRTSKSNYSKLFKNFSNINKDLIKANKFIVQLNEKRKALLLKIFDELEKNPANYQHIMVKHGKRKAEPISPQLIKKFRANLLQAVKNPHGGPGCDCCEDLEDCWCAFKIGPLCCYLCASIPEIIQCHW